MPLINYRTNLTTLRYGMDRPGGGDSGQPYMQFPIEGNNNPDVTDNIQTYYDLNRQSLDFPIRGGAISELLDSTVSAGLDRERIQKFFKDAPRGTTFIQKQVGLQLSNPRTQVPESLQFVGLSLGNAVLPTTQTYNPLNTLAQVRVSGTGFHFNRHGVSPTIYENQKQTYQYYVGAPENNSGTTNRLAILRALKLIGDTGFTLDKSVSSGLGIDPGLVDRLGISILQNQLFNYSGGPGSVYGIGTTTIDRIDNTEQVGMSYSNIGLVYSQLAKQDTTDGKDIHYPNVQDFRSQLSNSETPNSDYEQYSIEKRLGTGNPGGQWVGADATDYAFTSKPGALDTVNMRTPFYYDVNSTNPWDAGDDKPNQMTTKDMIKFSFECLDNDSPGNAMGLIFRAFLEGQIADNNNAEFNTFKYLGRGETFRTYQGFNRSISFSFKIAAQTRDEMRPLFRKLNHLISQVYPDYAPSTNIMRGNVVKVTIGDYIYRMPGFLENVNVTIDNGNTPWEILLSESFYESEDDPNKDAMRQLPHFVTVACTFYPILDILPRKEKNSDPDVQLIVNRNVKKREPEPAVPIDIAQPPSMPGITTPPIPTLTIPPLPPSPPATVQPPAKKQVQKKKKKKVVTTVPIKKPETPQFNFIKQIPIVRDNTRIAGNGLISGMGTAGGF
jgi:hypothetical protein